MRKEGNIRALLPALDQVLWPELEWTPIGMSELVTPQQVKIRYMKAINKVHPDKVGGADRAGAARAEEARHHREGTASLTGSLLGRCIVLGPFFWSLQVSTDTVAHKMLAEGIFYTLNQAFDQFKQQNGL